jgi:hypothetical protein
MPIERETIVTDSGSGGAVAAVVVAVLAVLFLIWALNGGLNFSPGTGGTVDVDVPAVTVTPDGQ